MMRLSQCIFRRDTVWVQTRMPSPSPPPLLVGLVRNLLGAAHFPVACWTRTGRLPLRKVKRWTLLQATELV